MNDKIKHTVGENEVTTKEVDGLTIYESKPPKKLKFSDLRERMSPEAQERAKARTQVLLRELDSDTPTAEETEDSKTQNRG